MSRNPLTFIGTKYKHTKPSVIDKNGFAIWIYFSHQ